MISKGVKVTVTFIDILLIVILFLFVLIFAVKFIFFKTSSGKLLIKSGETEYIYDMGQNREVSINGVDGVTKIEIKDNKFKFTESPCPGKNCVHTSWVGMANYPIVCLPNKVSAFISAKNKIEGVHVDSISH